MEDPTHDDGRPLSKWWRHAAILVAIAGFAVLSFVTVRTYRDAPPIAERAVGPDGAAVYTEADVLRGQEVFLQYALMEHGSLWGHGAYLGPDYSATYLHRSTEIMRDASAPSVTGSHTAALAAGEASGIADAVRAELEDEPLRCRDRDAAALERAAVASFTTQKAEWRAYFGSDATPPGLPARYIDDRGEDRRADGVLRVGRMGDDGEPSGRGLLVHEQLALRPGRRQRVRRRRRTSGARCRS